MRSHINHLPSVAITTFLFAFAFQIVAPSNAQPLQTEESAQGDDHEWKKMALPYILYTTEDAVIAGAYAGISRIPGFHLTFAGRFSTKGLRVAYVKGEVPTFDATYVGKVRWDRDRVHQYPVHGDNPDYIGEAIANSWEVDLTSLHRITPHLELGPSFYGVMTRTAEVRDADGTLVRVNPFERLDDGGVLLAGFRARMRSTSTVRPMDGYVFDCSWRMGVAGWSQELKQPKIDIYNETLLSYTWPLREDRLRLYLRGSGRYQANAPPAVRNTLGGDKTVRGEHEYRLYGRKSIAGRAQLHWTVTHAFTLPYKVLHRISSHMPEWPMEIELVPFFDIGALNDRDFDSWSRTLMGYGAGIRFILPPDLVLAIDLARAPGGSLYIYAGIGETL